MRRDEINKYNRKHDGNRFWSGLLLLAAGGLLMSRQLGADIPDWLFHWPMILIGVGLLISFKSGFKNAGGLIMILVGVAFLLNDIIPNAHMENFIWPGVLMIAGIVFILRPRSQTSDKKDWEKWSNYEYNNAPQTPTPQGNEAGESPEFVQINSVFGGVKKIIFSKNFRGGEINAFMGGAEINLLQADIKQHVLLEINNVFGGTKLILPSNWDVKNEITAVFGGVEDKRSANLPLPDPNKVIILKGACVFGGIEIKNF